MRIGHGYDVHRFANESDKPCDLILGGVKIDHPWGLVAHSDGDVLIHAVCDALLGAAGLGDIGKHFPDTSDQFENIDSRILLRNVALLIHDENFAISNIDVTVIAQTPKLAPHISAMVSNLATDLKIENSRVNVKATTTENLGFTGRKEGISTHAVALLLENQTK